MSGGSSADEDDVRNKKKEYFSKPKENPKDPGGGESKEVHVKKDEDKETVIKCEIPIVLSEAAPEDKVEVKREEDEVDNAQPKVDKVFKSDVDSSNSESDSDIDSGSSESEDEKEEDDSTAFAGFKDLSHSRMLSRIFSKKSKYRDYKLTLTGHSLGGGTAVLLAFMLKLKFPDLECWAFSPPGGLLNDEAATESEKFVTTTIVGNDLIPRTSLEAIRKLQR
jgi:hypothetical protein